LLLCSTDARNQSGAALRCATGVRGQSASPAHERASFQSCCNELCALLAVPRAGLARQDERDNAYVYDKTVWFDDGDGKRTANFIDLYKRACFVMEAKQGSEADDGGPGLFDPTASIRGTKLLDYVDAESSTGPFVLNTMPFSATKSALYGTPQSANRPSPPLH
jgi:hypothetical protein